MPGLDREIEEARRELHPPSRLIRLLKIMRRVVDARLVIPLLSEKNLVLTSPEVAWTPRPDGFLLVNEVRLGKPRAGAARAAS